MIDYRAKEFSIVTGLQRYVSTDLRPCEIVRQNQVAEVPDYPYGSYTTTKLATEDAGALTYCVASDGTMYRDTTMTISFTFQSDDLEEAYEIGMKAYDYFTARGLTALANERISVRRVTSLTPRDNLLSIQYEHRCGLDVTFGLVYTIAPDEHNSGYIETNEFKEE